MLGQCLVAPINKKVIFYSLGLEQQSFVALQTHFNEIFQYILKPLETFF